MLARGDMSSWATLIVYPTGILLCHGASGFFWLQLEKYPVLSLCLKPQPLQDPKIKLLIRAMFHVCFEVANFMKTVQIGYQWVSLRKQKKKKMSAEGLRME
jgi:hypothetical protein